MQWLLFALLSTLGWGFVNVLDSLLVHHHEKKPFLLMWSQALFSVPCLLTLGFGFDVQSEWMWLLMLFGITAYLGDLWFFYILDRLDVSVTNAAWAILSILLTIAGIFLFQESWGLQQFIGSVLIIGGVLFMSFWHAHVSLLRTLGLLLTQALVYVPFYIMKKVAIDAGEPVLAVFFWMILSRELFAVTLPLFLPKSRTQVRSLLSRASPKFFLIGGLVIGCFFAGEYFGALAYASGPLSSVAMVSNIQPFMVIGLAWMLHFFLPAHTAKETVSAQSAGIKVVSFLIVFLGLALLAGSQ